MLPAGLVAKAKVWEIPYAVEDADGAEQVLPAARSTFGMTNLGKTNNLLVFSFICYTSICALGIASHRPERDITSVVRYHSLERNLRLLI